MKSLQTMGDRQRGVCLKTLGMAGGDQRDLLPKCLEDWVPRDHLARFIRELVDALNLAKLGFQQWGSEEGWPPYSADLLLNV